MPPRLVPAPAFEIRPVDPLGEDAFALLAGAAAGVRRMYARRAPRRGGAPCSPG